MACSGVGSGPPPLTLPTTNLLAAWDARVGVTNDGSGFCSAWADQSGNGFHATQSTAGARPLISTSDGYASLLFDGVTDWLITTGISAGAGAKTIYVVIKPGAPTSNDVIWTSSTPLLYFGVRQSSYTFVAYDTTFRESGLSVGSSRCRVTYEIQSGAFNSWKDGVSGTPAAWGTNTAIGGTSGIGAGATGLDKIAAHIHALFIYTAARNTAVEDYITQEWGV